MVLDIFSPSSLSQFCTTSSSCLSLELFIWICWIKKPMRSKLYHSPFQPLYYPKYRVQVAKMQLTSLRRDPVYATANLAINTRVMGKVTLYGLTHAIFCFIMGNKSPTSLPIKECMEILIPSLYKSETCLWTHRKDFI